MAKLILSHDVALCFELLLRDEERASTNIDIVQIGNVTHYALVYLQGSRVKGRLSDTMGTGERWDLGQPWHTFVRDTETITCGHAGTAADHALGDLVSSGHLVNAKKTERERSTELIDWLRANGDDGLVACDVGVVSQLAHKDQSLTMDHILVPYSAPIPIGLAYDARDPYWGNVLLGCLKEVAGDMDASTQLSLRESASRLHDLGATWTLQLGAVVGDATALPRPALQERTSL